MEIWKPVLEEETGLRGGSWLGGLDIWSSIISSAMVIGHFIHELPGVLRGCWRLTPRGNHSTEWKP